MSTPPSYNLLKRTLSALVLIPLALAITYHGGIIFNLLISVITLIMYLEFKNIVLSKTSNELNKVKISRILWFFGGAFYVLIPALAVIYIRYIPLPTCASFLDTSYGGGCSNLASPYPLFWLFAVVWATDIGGYLFGKTIGGPRLAPAISPKKTWAGLLGGMLLAGGTAEILITQGAFWHVSGALPVRPFLAGAAFTVISQAGDLFESWVKRRFGVKDSGSLIPGHGGFLDRVDGLMFAAPVFALILYNVYGI